MNGIKTDTRPVFIERNIYEKTFERNRRFLFDCVYIIMCQCENHMKRQVKVRERIYHANACTYSMNFAEISSSSCSRFSSIPPLKNSLLCLDNEV